MAYKKIGYYNDIDAVMLNGMSADTVISAMNDGKGAFYPVSDEGEMTSTEIRKMNNKKFTKDKKYVVHFSVASRYEHIPLDLVVGNAQDEFIDIYEKC